MGEGGKDFGPDEDFGAIAEEAAYSLVSTAQTIQVALLTCRLSQTRASLLTMQWWNSLDTISRFNTLLQVTGAVIGVLIVTFGMRLAKLQTRMEWQALTDDQITEWAKALAPYNLTGLYIEKIDSNSDKLAGSLWKVGKKLNFSPSIQVNSYGPGITILASANYGAGNVLVNLFASSLGYAAVLKSERMSDPTSVMIFIGEKP